MIVSQCSTPCGDDGVQTRVVVCRDARGHVTNACRDQDQPPTTRSCPSQPACPSTMAPPTTATAPNRPPRQKGKADNGFWFLFFLLLSFTIVRQSRRSVSLTTTTTKKRSWKASLFNRLPTPDRLLLPSFLRNYKSEKSAWSPPILRKSLFCLTDSPQKNTTAMASSLPEKIWSDNTRKMVYLFRSYRTNPRNKATTRQHRAIGSGLFVIDWTEKWTTTKEGKPFNIKSFHQDFVIFFYVPSLVYLSVYDVCVCLCLLN